MIPICKDFLTALKLLNPVTYIGLFGGLKPGGVGRLQVGTGNTAELHLEIVSNVTFYVGMPNWQHPLGALSCFATLGARCRKLMDEATSYITE